MKDEWTNNCTKPYESQADVEGGHLWAIMCFAGQQGDKKEVGLRVHFFLRGGQKDGKEVGEEGGEGSEPRRVFLNLKPKTLIFSFKIEVKISKGEFVRPLKQGQA